MLKFLNKNKYYNNIENVKKNFILHFPLNLMNHHESKDSDDGHGTRVKTFRAIIAF